MSSFTAQPVQGMADLHEPELSLWREIERRAHDLFALHGFEEIRTPLLERAELFERSLGDGSDVVRKEMYVLEDRGGRRLALRPEGTAGVLRYAAGAGAEGSSARLYYFGSMFRAERPQAGRKRQFHQVGAEALGPPCPAADAECMALQADLLATWGLRDCRFLVNTRGGPEDVAAVFEGLKAALAGREDRWCEECRRRMEGNLWRILDCKEAGCRAEAASLPPMTSFMSGAARAYFDEVLRLLNKLNVAVEPAPGLVRGLDYYEHTVWEAVHPGLGAQDALAGGGRYRVRLGDRVLEGVGFAMGLERVLAALQSEGRTSDAAGERQPLCWVVTQGTQAFDDNLALTLALRRSGRACGMDPRPRSVKAQLRSANRAGARWVILRGDREMEEGVFTLKDMAGGEQHTCGEADLFRRLEAGGAGREGTD